VDRECILVVDDEALIRWSLHQRLEEDGFRVVEASSCDEAMAHTGDRPLLAVLDLKLPDGDGVGLFLRLRAKCPSCRAILMTAFGGAETLRKARDAGVFRVVDKPFDVENMVELVRSALAAPPGSTSEGSDPSATRFS
jgi:DNA-binding NtrC family response regulator